MDFFYLGLVISFFVVSVGIVYGCERLKRLS
jgi:hypothetical protein